MAADLGLFGARCQAKLTRRLPLLRPPPGHPRQLPPQGRDELFHNASLTDVDPRSIAQRIMEVRCRVRACMHVTPQ